MPSGAPEVRSRETSRAPEGVSELPFEPQEEGQGLVEYALVLVLIAIVVIAIVLLVWPALTEILNDAGIALPDQLESLF